MLESMTIAASWGWKCSSQQAEMSSGIIMTWHGVSIIMGYLGR